MSYEQLTESVDRLAAVNADLKSTVVVVRTEAESSRDAAQAFAIDALGAASEVAGELLAADTIAATAAKTQVDALRTELTDPTGTTKLGHEGITVAVALNTSPYDIRRFGGKPNDNTFNNLAAIKAALAKYGIAEFVGGVYNVVITSEADTITDVNSPTGNITLIFKDATIRHSASSFVLIWLNNKNLYLEGEPRFVYAGTYPANAGSVTKYGDTQASAAHFCGFVVLKGVAKIVSTHIDVSGETDANLYDFFFRGSFGTFLGSRITSVQLSHYCRAFADNIYGINMGVISGTKRHNKSSLHYGPSHLVYANFERVVIDALVEYGTLLSNENGDAGATAQTTNFVNAHVGQIRTTMDGVAAASLKVGGSNWSIGGILSKSDNFPVGLITENRPLVDIQTNLQNAVVSGVIGLIDIVMPQSTPNRTGFWLGGGDITANVKIKAPDYGVARNAPLAAVVTCRDSKVNLDIDTYRQDDHIYCSLADRVTMRVENRRNPILVKTGNLYTGASWGVCKGVRVELYDSPLGDSVVTWAGSLEDTNNSVTRRGIADTKLYKQTFNPTGALSLTITLPMDTVAYTLAGTSNNVHAYELSLTAGELNGNFIGIAKYLVAFKSGSSLGKTCVATQVSLYNSAVGSQAVIFAVTADTSTNTLTITATVTSGLLGAFYAKMDKLTGLQPRAFA